MGNFWFYRMLRKWDDMATYVMGDLHGWIVSDSN